MELDWECIEALNAVFTAPEQEQFASNVARIRSLAERERLLPDLLAEFAAATADLFAASAVAIWFRDPTVGNARTLQRKVSHGWSNLRLDGEIEDAHSQLVRRAFAQPEPLVAGPFARVAALNAVVNPTDSYLLFAPFQDDSATIGVVEIALGPKPLRKPHQQLLAAYQKWLAWLAAHLSRGIQRCFAQVSTPLLVALETVHSAAKQAAALQDQIRLQMESRLAGLAGQNFGTYADNQAVTKQVHQLLESKAFRVRCPECGMPAILRCQKSKHSKTGAFVFDHYLDSRRTFHGGQTIFPTLTLVKKPPRRPRN